MGPSQDRSHATLPDYKIAPVYPPSLEGKLGQKRQNRPRLPSVEVNLGQPPALEKKEGGKLFCLQGGQYGPICPKFPHGAKKERGVNSVGILDLSRVDLDFIVGFQAK